MKNIDIGLVWAKFQNIWGQVAVALSIGNTGMMVGVFYTTTIRPELGMPLWLFLLLLTSAGTLAVLFIVKWGISGYYRFFSQRSDLREVRNDVKMIKERLGIKD